MTDADANPHAARAIAAYRASQRLDQRPLAVLAAIHDELARALASAISAYDRRALDQMCRHNARATQLITGLTAALDQSAADVGTLQRFYGGVQLAVNRMLVDGHAIQTMRESLSRLNSMSFSFRSETNLAS